MNAPQRNLSPRLHGWRETVLCSHVAKILWAVLFLIAVCVAGLRAWQFRHVQGPYQADAAGFYDFNHGLYYPTLAFVEGVSPYGQQALQQYPLGSPIPLFAPSLFLLHAWVAWLPIDLAQAAFFGWNVLLLRLIARVSLAHGNLARCQIALVALLALSRGGQVTLYSGYFTLELVLGVLLALQYGRTRPWVAGCGMLLAASKPTYLIPLVILVAARREWPALVRGLALVVAINGAAGTWLLVHHPLSHLMLDLQAVAGEQLANPANLPKNSWTRVDALALLSKLGRANPVFGTQLLVMLLLLVLPGIALRRLSQEGAANDTGSLSGGLAALSLVICWHHQFYDTLLLAPLIFAAIASDQSAWRFISPGRRAAVAGLCIIPWFNLFSTGWFLETLGIGPGTGTHVLLTSLNAFALLIAWGGLLREEIRWQAT